VSTESAGPVSAPTLSLLVGGPPSSGSHGILGSAGPSLVGVSALGYPAVKQPDSSLYTGGQMSTSLATGIAKAEVHAELELEQSSYSSLRQPPAPARAARLPLEGPTLAMCLSVGPSATGRCSTKMAKRRITQTTPHDSPGNLVFRRQRSPRNSTGVTPYGAPSACRWGGSKSVTFYKQTAISRKRHKIHALFLLKSIRKSYTLYRMVTLPMTLSAP